MPIPNWVWFRPGKEVYKINRGCLIYMWKQVSLVLLQALLAVSFKSGVYRARFFVNMDHSHPVEG